MFSLYTKVLSWLKRLTVGFSHLGPRFRSQVSPCKTWGRNIDTERSLAPRTSILPPKLRTDLRIHIALTRKTKARNLGTLFRTS